MNLCKWLYFSFFSLFLSINIYAQVGIDSVNRDVNPFAELNVLYKGNVHDTIYMEKIDSLANSELDQSNFYSIDEMVENLREYERIAWSKKEYGDYRCDYYTILFNNVYLSNQWGASMFYAEKIAKQNEIEGHSRSLVELFVKMGIYGNMHRDEKVLELYEKERQNLEDVLEKTKQNPDEYYTNGMTALRVFTPVIIAYLAEEDHKNVEKIDFQANELIKDISKAKSLSDAERRQLQFYTFQFDYFVAYGNADYEKALKVLDKLNVWVKKNKEYTEFTYGITDWKIQSFLKLKQKDSAAFYIEKLKEGKGYVNRESVLIDKYEAEVELLGGNSVAASQRLLKALEESFKLRQKTAEETDNLLYAYTEAEHNRLAYEKSETEKQNRTKWIIAITLLSLTIIISGYVLFRQKDKKLRKTIKELDNTADIQIALMEQFEQKVRKEEQKRLSQNLHDDLAGTLATIKNNVDLQITETVENHQKENLKHLSEMIQAAFHNVRDKSHELFETAQLPDEKMFAQHIVHLAQTAFPDSHYKLNLQIDDYSLTNTSIEFRSELIRVIQEVFTNIIKHAKATQVDILIYKENEELFMVIKDNGKGLKAQTNQKTLGMTSMKNRLEKFKASFSVYNNKKGVTVYISIPDSAFN